MFMSLQIEELGFKCSHESKVHVFNHLCIPLTCGSTYHIVSAQQMFAVESSSAVTYGSPVAKGILSQLLALTVFSS